MSQATESPTRKRRRWMRDAFLLLLLLAGLHVYQTRATANGVAPPVIGADVRGVPVDLAAMRGQTVLVHFWATWCPVCRAEQSNIAAVAQDWAVIGIALEDTSAEDLRAYMEKAGLKFPTLRDAHGELAGVYGARAVPTTFVIDPAGQIRFTEVGYTTELGLRLRLWLAANMADPSVEVSAR